MPAPTGQSIGEDLVLYALDDGQVISLVFNRIAHAFDESTTPTLPSEILGDDDALQD